MGKLSTKSMGRRRMKIDRLDMKILTTLAEQSRQTITEVARNVGLSASPCTERLERGKLIIPISIWNNWAI
jgi:hypothetical protein